MFLDENYLLENATAKTIFASIKNLPVVDCGVFLQQISGIVS